MNAQDRFAEAFRPALSEKDRAVALAKQIIGSHRAATAEEALILARHLLRALALSES